MENVSEKCVENMRCIICLRLASEGSHSSKYITSGSQSWLKKKVEHKLGKLFESIFVMSCKKRHATEIKQCHHYDITRLWSELTLTLTNRFPGLLELLIIFYLHVSFLVNRRKIKINMSASIPVRQQINRMTFN